MSLLDEYEALSIELCELTQKDDLDPADNVEIRGWIKECYDKMEEVEKYATVAILVSLREKYGNIV